MKCKSACLLIVLVTLISFFAHPACAEMPSVYDLGGIRIGIPDDLIVFTHDTTADDPGLAALGLTYEFVQSKMEEDCTSLNAMDHEMDLEITVSIDPVLNFNMLVLRNLIAENMISSVPEPLDYNLISDDALLKAIAFTATKMSGRSGIAYDSYGLYRHPQAKFVRTNFKVGDTPPYQYYLEYSTVYENRYFSILLRSLSGKITSSQEAMMKGIVDSIVFDPSYKTAEAEPELVVYELNVPGISIGIPSDLVVFTRDTTPDDPDLALYGYQWDEYMAKMESQSCYLKALSVSTSFDISVSMIPETISDYNQFSDDRLMDMARNRVSENSNSSGMVYTSYDLYKHPQTKFIKMLSRYEDTNRSLLIYDTLYGGKLILIMLISNAGEVTPSQDALMKEVIDSVRFFTAGH
jgi:hypothetical protein